MNTKFITQPQADGTCFVTGVDGLERYPVCRATNERWARLICRLLARLERSRKLNDAIGLNSLRDCAKKSGPKGATNAATALDITRTSWSSGHAR